MLVKQITLKFEIIKVVSGIDVTDTIVIRCTEKGTKTTQESLKSMRW
ncbi:MAG: hypothetical protein OEL81_06175 [Nitrosopumilus sp.]|nr:hypothetical protein [Nitrosopumilus sp.]MDH3764412.1 hypothetical protein [Nitrosopumilus sp.]